MVLLQYKVNKTFYFTQTKTIDYFKNILTEV